MSESAAGSTKKAIIATVAILVIVTLLGVLTAGARPPMVILVLVGVGIVGASIVFVVLGYLQGRAAGLTIAQALKRVVGEFGRFLLGRPAK